MLVIWWAAAVGRYLRMPHSLAVAVLLSVLVLLLFPFVVALVNVAIFRL